MARLTLLLISLFISLSIFADDDDYGWSFQPKAGLLISSMTTLEAEPKLSVTVGGELLYNFDYTAGFSLGIQYMSLGATESKGKDAVNINCISFPASLNLHAGDYFTFKPGLSADFNFSGHTNNRDLNSYFYPSDATLRKLGFSFLVGLAFEYRYMVAEVRYVHSLNKTFRGSHYDYDAKSRCLMVTLGYRFEL